MFKRAGLTYKRLDNVIEAKYSSEFKDHRKKVVLQCLGLIKNNYNIIYIDEVGFQSNMRPLFGWSKKGAQAVNIYKQPA